MSRANRRYRFTYLLRKVAPCDPPVENAKPGDWFKYEIAGPNGDTITGYRQDKDLIAATTWAETKAAELTKCSASKLPRIGSPAI